MKLQGNKLKIILKPVKNLQNPQKRTISLKHFLVREAPCDCVIGHAGLDMFCMLVAETSRKFYLRKTSKSTKNRWFFEVGALLIDPLTSVPRN